MGREGAGLLTHLCLGTPHLFKRKLKFTNNQKRLPMHMPGLCYLLRKLKLRVTAHGMANPLGLSLVGISG